MGLSFSDVFGGGSKSKQTQTSQDVSQNWQTQAPWAQQAPYLQQGYASAADLLQNGGTTIPGFSDATQTAMGMTADRAIGGSDTLQGANAFNQFLTSGMGIQNPSVGFAGLNSLASNPTFFDVSAPTFDVAQFMGQIGGGGSVSGDMGSFRDVDTSGNTHLQNVQSGNFLSNQNPYLSQMYGAATNDLTRAFQNTVTPTLNATFGAGGRTGSGLHQGTLSDANYNLAGQLGDVAANLYGNAYQFERGQQDAAANNLMQNRYLTQAANQGADVNVMGLKNNANIANAGNQSAMARAALGANVDMARLGLDAQIANQGAYSDALNRVLNASNSISDNYFTGLNQGISAMNAAPGLAAADYADLDPLFKVGGMIDQQNAGIANEQWDLLSRYMDMIGAPIMATDQYGYGAATSTGTSSSKSSGGMFAPIKLSGSPMGGA